MIWNTNMNDVPCDVPVLMAQVFETQYDENNDSPARLNTVYSVQWIDADGVVWNDDRLVVESVWRLDDFEAWTPIVEYP